MVIVEEEKNMQDVILRSCVRITRYCLFRTYERYTAINGPKIAENVINAVSMEMGP